MSDQVPTTQAQGSVLFPLPKDLVELLIKVYSEKHECGGCNDDPCQRMTCCVCKKVWFMHENCPNNELHRYCNNCDGLICKECMSKCNDNGHYKTKKGIREQFFCEYDLEKGREFERSDSVFQNGKIIHYFDELTHQSRYGNFLCGSCALTVPRCEDCGCTMYLCTHFSGDGCQFDEAKKEELLRLHKAFSCQKHKEFTNYRPPEK